jgi:uncharacterized UPF0160 family protein
MKFQDVKIIGTHNGIFHADEVLAISMLSIFYDDNITVLRTRDPDVLKTCDILVDIGGGDFDHHMYGGNGVRSNKTPYASAGLVWKNFGLEILFKLNCPKALATKVYSKVDATIVEAVDKIDNGIETSSFFEFIPSFVPKWNEKFDAVDSKFNMAVNCTKTIFRELVLEIIATEKANTLLYNLLREKGETNILQIPSQNIKWQESIILFNQTANFPVDFVIFPYPNGGYAAQAVPKSLDNPFSKRIPFPNAWAGQTNKLPAISGVKTAEFCHNNLFFARAQTLNDVRKMCNLATSYVK